MTSMVYDLNSSSSFPDLNEDLLLSPNLSSACLSDYLPNFDHQNTTQYISSESSTRFIINDKPPSFSYSNSSSSFEFDAAAAKNERSREEYVAIDYCRAGIEGSSSAPPATAAKWIPTKMRITQKMSESTTDKPLKYTLRFHPNNSYYNDNSSSSSSIRVCSDCNTTTTPLWRSGPKGPKSLCNACGIRQRKARRALAAAAETATMGNSSSSSMGLTETYSSCGKSNKEKKLRAGHVTQCKKSPNNNTKINSLMKNFVFNNSSAALFPLPHDVEQAAILLMELSCGLLHHHASLH